MYQPILYKRIDNLKVEGRNNMKFMCVFCLCTDDLDVSSLLFFVFVKGYTRADTRGQGYGRKYKKGMTLYSIATFFLLLELKEKPSY